MKRSLSGRVNGWASSLNSLLLIESGPEALPIFKDARTYVTLSEETEMESDLKGCKSESGGKEVLLSSRTVCSVKKSFSLFALSTPSE